MVREAGGPLNLRIPVMLADSGGEGQQTQHAPSDRCLVLINSSKANVDSGLRYVICRNTTAFSSALLLAKNGSLYNCFARVAVI